MNGNGVEDLPLDSDGPFHRISDPAFELSIPRCSDHHPDILEDADATITLPDGRRYAATFMTPATVAKIMDRWQTNGECLNGEYFWCSDLIIMRRPGISAITDAVRDLVTTDELAGACSLLEPDELD